jgi:Tol biopolymer transport system component
VRIPSDLSKPSLPHRLGALGDRTTALALSHSGGLLAFTKHVDDLNVYRLDVSPDARRHGVMTRIIASTQQERFARYSPDGERIAFESDRSGSAEIWLCQADGSDPHPLTNFGGPVTGSPAWSPDGKQLAFDSRANGLPQIYVIAAQEGAAPSRVTSGTATNILPAWSPDGKFIYFSSNRTGEFRIWRVALNDHSESPMTNTFAFAPSISPDGKYLYYSASPRVWRMPIEGGTPEIVVDGVAERAYAVTPQGVVYLVQPDVRHAELRLWNQVTRKTQLIRPLDGSYDAGISPSPSGHETLLHRYDASGADLMLAEGFR